jgi:hypothetical protein
MMRKDIVGTHRIEVTWAPPTERKYDLGVFAVDGATIDRGLFSELRNNCDRKIILESSAGATHLVAEGGVRELIDRDSLSFVRTFRSMIRDIRSKLSQPLSMLVDINNISRIHLGSIVGQIYSDKIFRTVDYVYRSADYYIDGKPAVSKYNDDIFLQSVLENSTPYIPIPYLGGTYVSSPRMHMLINGGLDVRLQVPRLRALEPYRTDLIVPDSMRDSEVLQRIGLATPEEREKANVHVEFMGPRKVFEYVSYLRSWYSQLRSEDEIIKGQGVIFSVGWKTHHLMAALWCVSESFIPILTTSQDYITRVSIRPTKDIVCISIRNIGALYSDT